MLQFWVRTFIIVNLIWIVLIVGVKWLAPFIPTMGTLSYIDNTAPNRDLYLFDIQRNIRHLLINDFSDSSNYDWSPDGNQIIYAIDGEVIVWDVYTRAIHPITHIDSLYLNLQWSPDGEHILYEHSRDTYVLNLQTYLFTWLNQQHHKHTQSGWFGCLCVLCLLAMPGVGCACLWGLLGPGTGRADRGPVYRIQGTDYSRMGGQGSALNVWPVSRAYGAHGCHPHV